MNIKKLLVAVLVAAVAIALIFLVLPKDETSTSTDTVTDSIMENPSDGGSGEQAGLPTYTMTQVAEHDSRTDCWTVINGSVYNLTSFISQHPGGDEILRACGRDGTTLFTERETEDGEEVGSGTPHSSDAAAQLARLKIGDLAE